MVNRVPACRRRYSFFSNPLIASFSSASSAYIRLSRLFSDSNSLTRTSSETSSPAVLGLPFVIGGRTNPVLAPDRVGRQPGIGFLQDLHDLTFGKSRPFHPNRPAKSCQKVLLPACLA